MGALWICAGIAPSVIMPNVAPAETSAWTINAEEWAQPRSGVTVMGLPGLNAAVQAWLVEPTAMMILAHPVGEEGEVWASELRSWLVALGVPAQQILLQTGQESAMTLHLAPPVPASKPSTRIAPPPTDTLEIIPAQPASPLLPDTSPPLPLSFEILEQP